MKLKEKTDVNNNFIKYFICSYINLRKFKKI